MLAGVCRPLLAYSRRTVILRACFLPCLSAAVCLHSWVLVCSGPVLISRECTGCAVSLATSPPTTSAHPHRSPPHHLPQSVRGRGGVLGSVESDMSDEVPPSSPASSFCTQAICPSIFFPFCLAAVNAVNRSSQPSLRPLRPPVLCGTSFFFTCRRLRCLDERKCAPRQSDRRGNSNLPAEWQGGNNGCHGACWHPQQPITSPHPAHTAHTHQAALQTALLLFVR